MEMGRVSVPDCAVQVGSFRAAVSLFLSQFYPPQESRAALRVKGYIPDPETRLHNLRPLRGNMLSNTSKC